MAGVNDNLIPPVKGEVRNPRGKPKGTKHISTWIQNLMDDEQFEADNVETTKGKVAYQGAPMKAIIQVAVKKALDGDSRWAEWLAKYGYGQKYEVEHSGELKTGTHDPELAEEFSEYLKGKTKK